MSLRRITRRAHVISGKGIIERDIETIIPEKQAADCACIAEADFGRCWRRMLCSKWAIRAWSRWMGESKPGERPAIRLKQDSRPSPGTLLVHAVEFFNDLVRKINRVLIIDHDFHGLFASAVDHNREASLLGHGLGG